MDVGEKLIVKLSVAQLIFADHKDCEEPVKIVEIRKRKGRCSVVFIETASGKKYRLHIGAFDLSASDQWRAFKERIFSLPPEDEELRAIA